MIEINHLTKTYGDHNAVDDLSLKVEPGKIYGFLGPNGAGKSTTMNMITGYIGATSGEIKINGFDIFEEPESAKKCVGYLPEFPPLYIDMTVKEYLTFVAELKKVPKAERQQMINDIMDMTHIADVQDRLIKNLSKGYKQRVGLAQAVMGYPEVIILDEPTVGLDPKQIIEVRDFIRKLGENHTVILSSHILSEIKEVCDYIFIISKGKLVASDTTENLLNQFEGNMEVSVLVDEKVDEISLKIQQLDCVEKVSVEEGHGDEKIIKAVSKSNADIRKQVFRTVADCGVDALEIKVDKHSLEEVFIELTGGEQ